MISSVLDIAPICSFGAIHGAVWGYRADVSSLPKTRRALPEVGGVRLFGGRSHVEHLTR